MEAFQILITFIQFTTEIELEMFDLGAYLSKENNMMNASLDLLLFRQELQRLRNNERDLIRLNRDLVKIAPLPSISQFPSSHQSKELSRKQTPRLSSIAEENSPVSIIGRSSSLSPSRASINYPTDVVQTRSLMNKNDSQHEHLNWLRKYSFPRVVAKTSDDRLNREQHQYIINQQKRLLEQKLQQFLHEIK
jgi:hypothetical protein